MTHEDARLEFARACVSDPEWRRHARKYARYLMGVGWGVHVPQCARDFALNDRVSRELGAWLVSRAAEIYRQRFPFDQEFMRLVRNGEWPREHLAEGEWPIGVNKDNMAVRAAVKDALTRKVDSDGKEEEGAKSRRCGDP